VREAWRRKAGLRGAPVEPQRDGKVKVASAWNDNGFNIRPGLRCSVQRGRWGGAGRGETESGTNGKTPVVNRRKERKRGRRYDNETSRAHCLF
jgi:hypothetical protein